MRKIKELEDKILYLLANSKGDILDDIVLIDTLAVSKVTSNEIAAAVEAAAHPEYEGAEGHALRDQARTLAAQRHALLDERVPRLVKGHDLLVDVGLDERERPRAVNFLERAGRAAEEQ